MQNLERRRFARFTFHRPIKIYHESSARFLAGRSRDLSPGGSLIELPASYRLQPGQRIRFGMAHTERQALIEAESMHTATIVRCLSFGDTQQVAMVFDVPLELSLAESA
ncbi:MAG: PilZ domain-containing protein [Phycisphaeraceae bacterium]|nr:PilZ domain-containing protein [Phycisphaeraceae bacterium]